MAGMRRSLVLYLFLVSLLQPLMASGHPAFFPSKHSGDHSGFLFSKNPVVSLPMIVFVGHLGISDVQNDRLQRFLNALYHTHIPTDLETEEPVYGVSYHIRFVVEPIPLPIIDLESRLATAIVLSMQEIDRAFPRESLSDPLQAEIIPIDIVRHLEPVLQQANENHVKSRMEKNQLQDYFCIYFIKPDLQRIKNSIRTEENLWQDILRLAGGDSLAAQNLLDGVLGYSLTYGGNNPYSSISWLSKSRYVVVDLTAERYHLGPLTGDVEQSPLTIGATFDGAFSGSADSEHNTLQAAQLGSITFSALRHLALPDINYVQYSDPVEKILVPIMIFKDHEEHVDIVESHIKSSMKTLFPEASVHVVFGHHSLHDHKHISMAVAKSMRESTTHELDKFGKFFLEERPYLDSRDVIHELKKSGDILARGFLDKDAHASTLEAFFKDLPVASEVTGRHAQKGSLLDRQSSYASYSQGTRVLPVYVFSLFNQSPDLTLEDFSLSQGTNEAVIVLHTNNTEIAVPFYVDEYPITVSGQELERHVLAGIALSQGLLPPTVRYSAVKNKLVEDYTWATGHHPFGHYSNAVSFSKIHEVVIRRNMVLSRLNKAIRLSHEVLEMVDHFAKKYMHGALVDFEDGDLSFVDQIFHIGTGEDPDMYIGAVDRLHEQLHQMEGLFDQVASQLKDSNYEEALKQSNNFVFAAKTLHSYAKQELAHAEVELRCCSIEHKPSVEGVFYTVVTVALLLFALVVPLLFVGVYMFIRQFNRRPSSQPIQLRQTSAHTGYSHNVRKRLY